MATVNMFTDRSHAAVQANVCAQNGKIDELAQKQMAVKKLTEEVAVDYPRTAKLLGQTAQECAWGSAAALQAEKAQEEVKESGTAALLKVEQLRVLLQIANPMDLIEAMSGDLDDEIERESAICAQLHAQVDALEKKLLETRETRSQLKNEIENVH